MRKFVSVRWALIAGACLLAGAAQVASAAPLKSAGTMAVNAPGFDPTLDRMMVEMENMTPDTVVNGDEVKSSNDIKVKAGSIVEVQFAQAYADKEVWWFAGTNYTGKDFFLFQDFHGVIENGQAMIHKPGKKFFRFKAPSLGAMTLKFHFGQKVDDWRKQVSAPYDSELSVTFTAE